MAFMLVLFQHATAPLPSVPQLHALLYHKSANAIALCNCYVALKVLPLRNSNHVDAVACATPQRRHALPHATAPQLPEPRLHATAQLHLC